MGEILPILVGLEMDNELNELIDIDGHWISLTL